MLTISLSAFLIPLVLVLLCNRVMMTIAPRLGFVDRPTDRKFHTRVTALGGGVSIFLAVMLTLGLVMGTAWLVHSVPGIARRAPAMVRDHADGVLSQSGLLGLLVITATVQMGLGFLDDCRKDGLDYRLRLAVEVGLVSILISQGVCATLFTHNLWITVPITILWVVGLTNAMNFLDNMDGLSAGVGFWASMFFSAIAYLIGEYFIFGCFLILAGALLGFLRHNWQPAKIFLGDAGSNFLGFWIGVLTIIGTFHTEQFSHVTIFAPLCILAVPIYDCITVLGLRILQRKNPFEPDKQHFSHRLVDLGFSPTRAVLLIHLMTITTGLSGLLLYHIRSAYIAPIVVLQVIGMLGIIALLEAVAHRRTLALRNSKEK